jgi:ribonuclease T2
VIRIALMAFLAAVLGASAALAQTGERPRGGEPAGRFDYYVLALSWSPSYCADPEAAARDSLQCAAKRPFAFVLHGLWPQFERGWPERCPTRQPRDVAPALKSRMLDMMPSPVLIEHQWDKHGVCSGLDQNAYFETSRRLRNRVVTPPAYQNLTKPLMVTGRDVETAFLAANPGLTADQIVVQCDRRRLREVRVCFTKDGLHRRCGGDVRERCDGKVAMPPLR